MGGCSQLVDFCHAVHGCSGFTSYAVVEQGQDLWAAHCQTDVGTYGGKLGGG